MEELRLEGSFRLSYNGSMFAREGLGYLLTFDHLIDTSPDSGGLPSIVTCAGKPSVPDLEEVPDFLADCGTLLKASASELYIMKNSKTGSKGRR